MNRQEAYNLINEYTENKNLVKHMLSVEAEMRGLANHFNKDEDLWGLAGLLHDLDYEMSTKDDSIVHPLRGVEILEERGVDNKIISAVRAHAWGHVDGCPEPQNNMEWALYTCDELSGLIIAVALVRPDKELSSVSVDSVMKKWDSNSFASGVDRGQSEYCEDKLGIELEEFVSINLKALQGISEELGL